MAVVGTLRARISLAQQAIASAEDQDVVISTLADIALLLPREIDGTPHAPGQFWGGKQPPQDELIEQRRVFCDSHYAQFCEFLLRRMPVEWLPGFTAAQRRDHFDVFFEYGPPTECLFAISRALSWGSDAHPLVRDVIAAVLRNVVPSRLTDSLREQCGAPPFVRRQRAAAALAHDAVVNLLLSLPDRAANMLQKDLPPALYPTAYARSLSAAFACVTDEVAMMTDTTSVSAGDDDNTAIAFLRNLFGRAAAVGFSRVLVSHVFAHVVSLSGRIDFGRVLATYASVFRVDDAAVETVAVASLMEAARLNSSAALTVARAVWVPQMGVRATADYVLGVKLMSVRCIDENAHRVLVAVLSADAQLLVRSLSRAVDGWRDPSHQRHASVEQRTHATRSVLALLGAFRALKAQGGSATADVDGAPGDEWLRLVLAAVESHLRSSVPEIRAMGMAVAEAFAATFSPNNALSFDYPEDAKSSALVTTFRSLCRDGAWAAGIANTAATKNDESVAAGSTTPSPRLPSGAADAGLTVPPATDEDPDADLIPYDMDEGEGAEAEGGGAPFGAAQRAAMAARQSGKLSFVRNCLDGLRARDDPAGVEAALRSVERAIEAHSSDAADTLRNTSRVDDYLGDDAVRILLHLQDEYAINGFDALRRRALSAAATRWPVGAGCALVREFYGDGYGILQRMEGLDVLVDAARRLADARPSSGSLIEDARDALNKKTAKGASATSAPPAHSDKAKENETPLEAAKRLRDLRIEAKTRRFASARKAPPPTRPNRFAAVALRWFYGLINGYDGRPWARVSHVGTGESVSVRRGFDGRLDVDNEEEARLKAARLLLLSHRETQDGNNRPDLVAQEHMLLGRLAYALGTFVACAANQPIVAGMGRALLEFVWALRYHADVSVRRGLVYCTAMVASSLPPHALLVDLQEEVVETQEWLRDVFDNDADPMCRELAAVAVCIILDQIKQFAPDVDS